MLLLAGFVPPLVGDAHGAGAAMVTDLQGKATVASGGDAVDIGILAEVPADATVNLAAAARLVVLYLISGDEYAFRGPVTIRFHSAAPETSGGAPAERRGPALGTKAGDIRIKPVGLGLAAVVMRSTGADGRGEALAPAHGTILDTRPQFVWKAPLPGLRYAFELDDSGGNPIVETEVDETSLALPSGVELAAGASYSWRISARLPNGRKFARNAEFTVASADLRERVQALRPSASGALSNRVVYAAWLEQMDLKDEARKYWRAAAAERPDDVRLKTLAGE
jgi:hypothetical protein